MPHSNDAKWTKLVSFVEKKFYYQIFVASKGVLSKQTFFLCNIDYFQFKNRHSMSIKTRFKFIISIYLTTERNDFMPMLRNPFKMHFKFGFRWEWRKLFLFFFVLHVNRRLGGHSWKKIVDFFGLLLFILIEMLENEHVHDHRMMIGEKVFLFVLRVSPLNLVLY